MIKVVDLDMISDVLAFFATHFANICPSSPFLTIVNCLNSNFLIRFITFFHLRPGFGFDPSSVSLARLCEPQPLFQNLKCKESSTLSFLLEGSVFEIPFFSELKCCESSLCSFVWNGNVFGTQSLLTFSG